MIAVAIGLVLQFADLMGYLKNKNRLEILNWLLHSNSGISLDPPAAQEFVKKSPPPLGERIENLTHLTKNVIRQENGSIYNASINYMRKDYTRTNFAATLDDIRNWTSESPYPWFAWWAYIDRFCRISSQMVY